MPSYAWQISPRSWRSYARPPPPELPSPDVAGPSEEAGHYLPGPGGYLRAVHAPLRPPFLPLPPRRPAPRRPAPDLQGERPDALRVRPQGLAPRGAHVAGRTPAPQGAPPRDPPTVAGSAEGAGATAQAQGGAALIAGRALVQTTRHFFPQLPTWLDRLPDSRLQEACTYPTRFLAWWGIALYLFQLGSRRQLDYDLRDGGPQVLANLNRLAQTQQTTLPVHDTLDHFLGHVRLSGWEHLRTQLVQRLLRMKALDAARLLGQAVLLLDGTGLICFHRRHCPHCLVQRHGAQTLYLHHVLEAKLLGPAGVVVSLGSEFIENADTAGGKGRSAEEVKQDCELKAAQRLLPRIKKDYPQLRIVLALESLYGWAPLFALAQDLEWSYVVTFKEGRTPALWQEFRALLPECPENYRRRVWGDGRVEEFRWVEQLAYADSAGRLWKLNALECTEMTSATGEQYFAWLTPLPVNQKTVAEIAQKGGRYRWKVENEGFNRQKNSGLNLEHVYSTDPEKWKAYYLLLQIAFVLVQLLERGSLLRRLAEEAGRPVWKLFGSLKNVARRLLDGIRFVAWAEEWFDARQAARLRIGLDSS